MPARMQANSFRAGPNRSRFDRLTEYPFHKAYAGVTLPNYASVALHRKLGFVEIGVFP